MTSIKEAIARWEAKTGKKAAEEDFVDLKFQIPSVDKMDTGLSAVTHCTKLSLSTNAIEKISNLNGFQNLTILSLARNNIRSLMGLEAVSGTLEQLWISYNNIEKLKGVHYLEKLRVLYMSNNKVTKWEEFRRLSDCPNLEDLLFVGNPLEAQLSVSGDWGPLVMDTLLSLKKLDGVPLIREEH